MVGKILVKTSSLVFWAPDPATHSFAWKGFGKGKWVAMPTQPRSAAQSRGKQSVTKKTSAKKPNSFRGKSDRQFSNRLSPNRLTDLSCEVSHWGLNQGHPLWAAAGSAALQDSSQAGQELRSLLLKTALEGCIQALPNPKSSSKKQSKQALWGFWNHCLWEAW